MRTATTLCISMMLAACTGGTPAKDDTDRPADSDTDPSTVDLAATVHVMNLYVADGQSASSLAVRLTRGFVVDATVPYFARTVGKAVPLTDGVETVTFEAYQPGAPEVVLATATADLVTQRTYDVLLTGTASPADLHLTVLPLPPTDPAPNLARVTFLHAAAAWDAPVDVWLGGDAAARATDLGPHDLGPPFDMNPDPNSGDTLVVTPAGVAPGTDNVLSLEPNALFEVGAHHVVALVHPPSGGHADVTVPLGIVVFDR